MTNHGRIPPLRQCAGAGCLRLFTPARADHLHCSELCQHRTATRQRRRKCDDCGRRFWPRGLDAEGRRASLKVCADCWYHDTDAINFDCPLRCRWRPETTGYDRHLRDGTEPCDAAQSAHSDYHRIRVAALRALRG